MMPSSEWDAFCSRLDDTLKPMTCFKQLVRSIFILCYIIITSLLLLVLGVGITSQTRRSTFRYRYFLMGFAAAMVALVTMSTIAMLLRRRVQRNIMAVCQEQRERCSAFFFQPHFEPTWRLLTLTNKWFIKVGSSAKPTKSSPISSFVGIPTDIDSDSSTTACDSSTATSGSPRDETVWCDSIYTGMPRTEGGQPMKLLNVLGAISMFY